MRKHKLEYIIERHPDGWYVVEISSRHGVAFRGPFQTETEARARLKQYGPEQGKTPEYTVTPLKRRRPG